MEGVGIGCFWFARNRKAVKADPRKHLEDVKSALEGVDSVSNVKVVGEGNSFRVMGTPFWRFAPRQHLENVETASEGATDVTNVGRPIARDEEEDAYGLNYFPIYGDVIVDFDMFIPKRVQTKQLNWKETSLPVENFHVTIFYRRKMPFALVRYTVDANEDELRNHSPSDAVVVVRKYLAEKLREHPVVEFMAIGPSPFHANVFLTKSHNSKPAAEDLSLPGGGYRTVVIRLGGDTPEKKIAEFVAEYGAVLGAFYEAVRVRLVSMELRAKVTTGAQGLLEEAGAVGNSWMRFNRWRRFGKQIDRVYSDLLSEKMYRSALKEFASGLRQDEEVLPDNVFYKFIERETGPRSDVPDEDIRELLIMLEERRRGYFQDRATLLAGLVGGVLGALIGAGASFELNSRVPAASPHPEQLSMSCPSGSLSLRAWPSPELLATGPILCPGPPPRASWRGELKRLSENGHGVASSATPPKSLRR
jgi:hypothetical protein